VVDWAKAMNFAVWKSLAYPLYQYQKMYADKYNRHYRLTSAKWLSPEWSEMVAATVVCRFDQAGQLYVRECMAGGREYIDKAYRTQIYGDSSFQQSLTCWNWPDTQWVNHPTARP
jgi:hypothetical protein